MNKPRMFTVVRRSDESGVSGTGRVLDGVVFHTGQVVICWRGDLGGEARGEEGYSSIALYPCWEAFRHIHIDAHPDNDTEVIFSADGDLDRHVRASGFLDAAGDSDDAADP